jgi:hypothetical protein
MYPAGVEGRVGVVVVAEKFSMFKKNCCQGLVGLLELASKNSACG